jgi:hypothetical protein
VRCDGSPACGHVSFSRRPRSAIGARAASRWFETFMAEVRVEKSTPEESRRWAQYLERRMAALLGDMKLRHGIRLAVLPSFTPSRCWAVEYRLRRSGRGEAMPGQAVLSVCEVEAEYERFNAADAEEQATFSPRIVRTVYEVSPASLDELEQILAEVAVPLSMARAPFGTDGTTYVLDREQSSNRLRIQWWAGGPSNWSSVTASFEAIWAKLERLAEGG